MKRVINGLIRSISLLLLVCAAAYGQSAKLDLSALNKLEAKASESVDISLDGKMLQLAGKFLSKQRGSEEAKVRELIAGLQSIYVKVYEFDKDGQYDPADVEALRAQLRGPGWKRMIGVLKKVARENMEVYVLNEGGNMAGLAIIAAEPDELTIINIIGPIDLDRLSDLAGNFGIPDLNSKHKRNSHKRSTNKD